MRFGLYIMFCSAVVGGGIFVKKDKNMKKLEKIRNDSWVTI